MPDRNKNRNSSDANFPALQFLAILIRRSGGVVVISEDEIRSAVDGVIRAEEGSNSVTLRLVDQEEDTDA
jgi:hypothetical protein